MIVTFESLGEWGRLGNQLFQIAATIGIARRNNCRFLFPPWAQSEIFRNPLPRMTEPTGMLSVLYEKAFHYQDVTISESTSLVGYFQSQKYFQHCAQEIRCYFSFRQKLLLGMAKIYAHLSGRPTCSVHVRRTDYVNNPYFIDLSDTDYYETAFARFAPETNFLFFSDDIAWCKKRFQDKRFIFIEGLDTGSDLALMSRCDAHIIANSSFSWWGAWLDPKPNKVVIAPTRWFAGEFANPLAPTVPPPPELRGFHDTRDLIPESWIRV